MIRFADVHNILICGTLVRYTPRPNGPPDSVEMSVEGYETDVSTMLSGIRWTFVGWALMMDIWRNRRQTMLIIPWNELPYVDAAGSWQGFNATAGPVTLPRLVDGPVDMGQVQRAAADARRHTLVRYNPAMWTGDAVSTAGFIATPADFRQAPGVQRDEILLHEMVHGLRQMSGTFDWHRPADMPHYDTVEEFMAIVVSNVYRSELRRPGLRRDHWGFQNLPAAQEDPAVFLAQPGVSGESNMTRMQEFKRQNAEFCSDMRRSPAVWNPFKLV